MSAGAVLDLVGGYGPIESAGEVRLWGSIEGTERFHRLYVIDAPQLDFSVLDELVLESQMPLFDRHSPTWERLRDASHLQEDDLSKRYLQGFASYLLGCQQESSKNWRSAGNAFEAAFHALRPFASPLARDVVAIVAFRMHAMHLLRDRGPESVWWQAANFFNTPPNLVTSVVVPRSGESIWIDEFQAGLLDAVASYCARNFMDVDHALQNLPAALGAEPGNERKRLLLASRVAVARGQEGHARNLYKNLRDDAVYAQEAATWS